MQGSDVRRDNLKMADLKYKSESLQYSTKERAGFYKEYKKHKEAKNAKNRHSLYRESMGSARV